MMDKLIKFINQENITEQSVMDTFSPKERVDIIRTCNPETLYLMNECIKRKIPLLYPEEAWTVITSHIDASDESLHERLAHFLTQGQITDFILTYGFYSFAVQLHDADMIIELLSHNMIPKDYLEEMISRMDDDNKKVKCMKMYLKRRDCSEVLKSIEDDNIKKDNLKMCPIRELPYVVSSFKNDAFKETFIMRLPFGKGEIIASLKSDKIKEKYFNKLFNILPGESKGRIIGSFNDFVYIEKYQDRLKSGSAILAFIVETIYGKHKGRKLDEIIEKLVGRINKEKDAKEILNYISDLKLRKQLLQFIHSDAAIKWVIECSSYKHFDAEILLDKGNRFTKEFIIRDIGRSHPEIAFKYLDKLSDINSVIKVISDFDQLPMYSSEYEYLVDMCCEKYKLNKEHFLVLVKTAGCALFTKVNNKNIVEAINADEETFQKYIKIINIKNATVTESAQNDVLNALIQRQFKIEEKIHYEIFSRIMDDLNFNNLDDAYLCLQEMSYYLEYKSFDTSIDKLFSMLKNERNQKTIDFLQTITNKYVVLKRNDYLQKHLIPAKEQCCELKYEKNAYAAYILKRNPLEEILSSITNITDEVKYNEDEMNLINNRPLLIKLIKFRKDPKNAEPLVLEEKKCLPILINLIDKTYNKFINAQYRAQIPMNYLIRETESTDIVGVMEELNIKQLKETLFNDEGMFNELLEFLNHYRIIGWGRKYEKNALAADVSCDAFTLASLINNYKAIVMRKRKEKGIGKENEQMTLTEMLDRASVYDSVSYRYSILIGKDNLFYFKINPTPYKGGGTFEERANHLLKILPKMYSRKTIPVPPMDENITLSNEKKLNVVVGNTTDLINLTLGERTGACMRIGGAADNLFDFCLMNDKGFHIVFYDPDNGDMVSRISCYRNGNTVYMNQLRHSISSKYVDDELIEATKMIAKRFVEKTRGHENPIENVFINFRYGMEKANMPIDTLESRDISSGLPPQIYLDLYDGVILLATSSPDGKKKPIDTYQPPEEYEPQRCKRRIWYDKKAQEKVAHYHLLDSVITGHSIDAKEIVLDTSIKVCIGGEDWYIAVNDKGKVEQFIMSGTKRREDAMTEMRQALEELNNKQLVSQEESRKLA